MATSVKEALELLKLQKADILISELAMPGEDGYSLIQKVRLCSNLKCLKAIAITAYTTDSGCSQALASGYQAYTEKPFDLDELVATVADLATKGFSSENAVYN
ncbi:response regulator [Tolypothrix bouteillei VB521301_2]